MRKIRGKWMTDKQYQNWKRRQNRAWRAKMSRGAEKRKNDIEADRSTILTSVKQLDGMIAGVDIPDLLTSEGKGLFKDMMAAVKVALYDHEQKAKDLKPR